MGPIKRGRSARLACGRVREATPRPPGRLRGVRGSGSWVDTSTAWVTQRALPLRNVAREEIPNWAR